MILVLNSY